jgi:triacylglycerol lipase
MYAPNGFSIGLSIELGELVSQSYAQFKAFENGKKWELASNYSLIKEIYYTWTPTKAIEKGMHGFDKTLGRFRGSGRNKAIRLPIGFLAQGRGNYYLVFRGTLTVKEWVRNVSMSLSPYLLPKHGNVHGGFLETYDSIRNEIKEALSQINHRAGIYVAGHSLGAALATLALPDIETEMKTKVTCVYTFGSPRVGDDTFVKSYNSKFGNRSFRIVNTSDIVTSIPFPAPIMGRIGGYFSHVDTPIDINVQREDLEENHKMKTYLGKLNELNRPKGLFGKLLAKSV